MPELLEVETAQRAVSDHCSGKKIVSSIVTDDSKVIDGVSIRSVREVGELYGSEKSFVVEEQRALSGLHSTALIALERDSNPVIRAHLDRTNTSETPPTVNEVYLHLHTVNHDGVTFIDTRSERFYDKLQRRRLKLTQATPDQPVDDEAVYFNVAGECPKGRVYGLGSLGRKKRRYADLGASTSQMPEMVPSNYDMLWRLWRGNSG
ncbi:hypothetical protein Scep_023430 [Stephania cephalantha]|uniref:Formamidopyrimidine-DNA glycosylase catalytic domain-containing protein n=1 Tax=Stephania cephalantha TaxID=152367 RepID=A0AAP0EUQ2_9MAGN